MTMAKAPGKHLRLVELQHSLTQLASSDLESKATERSLFATRDTSILIFADFDNLGEAEFLSFLVAASPKWIVDLRRAPRFDVGNLNRKLVFSFFEKEGSRYFDMSGLLGASYATDVRLNPNRICAEMRSKVFREYKKVDGPIAFLAETAQMTSDFVDSVAANLDDLHSSGWQTMRIPETKKAARDDGRSVLFISHATPDDNDFARWLGTQLTLAGYEIWADFDRLHGGELFWDTIEDTIRNKSFRFIVAASRLAQTRGGVLDEIHLAVSVERASGIDGFVIPLRIDDLPFLDFRANIARKNILDFSANWSVGLKALLNALEQARAPKGLSGTISPMALTIHDRLSETSGVAHKADPILLNWLEIEKLPQALNVFGLSVPASRLPAISRSLAVPHVVCGNAILTFSRASGLHATIPDGVTLHNQGAVLTSEFLKGQAAQFPSIGRSEARRILSNLIRQGWEIFARSKGLHSFEMASGQLVWFFENGFSAANKVQFVDIFGKKRRKSLVGHSPKRGVYWHYAVEMRLAPGFPYRIIAKPHVLFTENGRDPLPSASRMHALRRGFCKTWWNDRWRDLLIAYVSWLGDDSQHMPFDVGANDPILVSAQFMMRDCPVAPENEGSESEIVDLELDDDFEESDPDEEELELASMLTVPIAKADEHYE